MILRKPLSIIRIEWRVSINSTALDKLNLPKLSKTRHGIFGGGSTASPDYRIALIAAFSASHWAAITLQIAKDRLASLKQRACRRFLTHPRGGKGQ